jgi:chromosomal replication initiation ATPase DnaA
MEDYRRKEGRNVEKIREDVLKKAKFYAPLKIYSIVKEEITEKMGYPPDSPSRSRSARRAKWVGAYLLRSLTSLTHREIAQILGYQDHSAVYWALKYGLQKAKQEGWADILTDLENAVLQRIFTPEGQEQRREG